MIHAVKKRFLVIDDDNDVLAYLYTWLTDHDFIVDVAHDGIEAAAKLKEQRPDLITLDIIMPNETGIRFYREIKKDPQYASIPVIIITGIMAEFEEFISHRRTVPAPDGYISKPFKEDELSSAIKKVLEREKSKNGKLKIIAGSADN
ncbi:MAG: response regulator [Deltaproteobacteria bacterium]|nr:response regulator [Deltaproteobacteria bacterium]MCL5276718.1 response regulator [Deltaproteobacteria bacterium]